MRRPGPGWYVLAALVALAPLGARVLTWRAARVPAVDPVAAQAGDTLFKHEWKPRDPLSPGGDGLGPVYNAKSCVACHKQGGPGGAGGLEHNVTTVTVRPEKPGEKPRTGVVHAYALQDFQETLNHIHPALPPLVRPVLAQLVARPGGRTPAVSPPRGVILSQLNTPALFGARAIDVLPERVILAQERKQQLKWGMRPAKLTQSPVGRAARLPDGRVGRFGWKGQTASLFDFVQAACANELGLGNPGATQPRSLAKPNYQAPGLDLSREQCEQLTAFVSALPPPVERVTPDVATVGQAELGKSLFRETGCADCHTPDLGPIKGIYSDLLLHRMGQELEGGGGYAEPLVPVPDFMPEDSPQSGEWRTPPLWGVADSAPYLHDGRAATLEEAIQQHAGQGTRAAERFSHLRDADKAAVIAFLKTLRAP